MSQVIIHNLTPRTFRWLEERAAANGRSMQEEIREILERTASVSASEVWSKAAAIRKKLAGRTHSDSGDLQSEDRTR